MLKIHSLEDCYLNICSLPAALAKEGEGMGLLPFLCIYVNSLILFASITQKSWCIKGHHLCGANSVLFDTEHNKKAIVCGIIQSHTN